jgi:hypothetical protein
VNLKESYEKLLYALLITQKIIPIIPLSPGGGEGEHTMSTPTSILPPAYRRQASRGRIRLGSFHVLWEANRP